MEDSKRYEIRKYAAAILSFALEIAVLAYVLFSGLTFQLRDFAQSFGGSPWITVLVYVAVLSAALKLLELPLSFYSGYVLEHQYGLSRMGLGGWLKDQSIGVLVALPLTVLAAEAMYFFMRSSPDYWWAYTGMAFIAFAVLMANLAPVLLLPLFFKFKPVEDNDLRRSVERLTQKTQTPICGIFEWALGEKTRKANAAVVGWGNTRRIIVSDTLLRNFTTEEIEVIMAHELCHHVRNHMWLTIAVQTGIAFIGFYVAHLALRWATPYFGFTSLDDVANFPFLVLLAAALSLLVLPAVNAFSRRLEREADLYALEITGDSLAFVSSMEKLASLNLASTSPNRIIEFVFYSHPSIEKRIRMAADRVGQSA